MGPDWRGVDWADSASPCPCGSTRPAPKSSDSRMIDEYDIRMSLWPISVAMFSSAPWMTLTVTGSTGRLEPPARPFPAFAPAPLPRPAPRPPSPPLAPRLFVGLSLMVIPRLR